MYKIIHEKFLLLDSNFSSSSIYFYSYFKLSLLIIQLLSTKFCFYLREIKLEYLFFSWFFYLIWILLELYLTQYFSTSSANEHFFIDFTKITFFFYKNF